MSQLQGFGRTIARVPFLQLLRRERMHLERRRSDLLSKAGLHAFEAGVHLPAGTSLITELHGLFQWSATTEQARAQLAMNVASDGSWTRQVHAVRNAAERTVVNLFVQPRLLRTARTLGSAVLAASDVPAAFLPYRLGLYELDQQAGLLEAVRRDILAIRSDDFGLDVAAILARFQARRTDVGVRARESGPITITAQNVSSRIGLTRVLKDVSFEVRPGEFVGILGPSGAGKSTLLGALNGTRPAPVGKVLYNGRDYYREFTAFRGSVGFVPQDDIIHPDLPVRTALLYGSMLRGIGEGDAAAMAMRVDQVLDTVRLTDRQQVVVRELSGGQRKRVSIAMELLADPPVLFLDEPTSGLDPSLEEHMMLFFQDQARTGRTIVITTHVLESIGMLDAVAILSAGQLAYFGPPEAAPEYFGVERFKEIYLALERTDPAELAERTLGSAFHRERLAVTHEIPSDDGPAGEPGPAAAPRPVRPGPASGPAAWGSMLLEWLRELFSPRQLDVLARRHSEILRADTRTTAILLLQAPFIAGLLALTSPRPTTLLFIMALSALWVGCSNSVREIVKERAIYERERVVFLVIPAYVASKLRNLAVLSLFQCTVLVLVAPLGSWSSLGGVGTMPLLFLTVMLTATAGIALGLLLSSLAVTSDKAISLVPIVILPQILFAGALIPLDDLGTVGRLLSHLMPLKWSYRFLQEYHLQDRMGGLAGMVIVNVLLTAAFLVLAAWSLRRRDPLSMSVTPSVGSLSATGSPAAAHPAGDARA